MKGDTCRIEGCNRICTKGLVCNTHVSRKTRQGSYDAPDTRGKGPFNRIRGAVKGAWSYPSVHNRLKRNRGSASQYVCECGEQAREWALDHDTPFLLVGRTANGGRSFYSPRMSDYKPMCIPCHRKKDSDFRWAAFSAAQKGKVTNEI